MKRWFSWVAIATALFIILGTGHRSIVSIDSATAQRTSPKTIAAQVYKQYPELPLENQYIRQRTGKVADKSTLVSRFIEYHTLTKGRSPKLRLDWKWTFADYLGLNEYLVEEKYPGQAYLKSNPMERDRTVIQSFNRKQRAELIQALVDLYAGRQAASSSPQSSPPSATGPVSQPARPRLQPLPSSQGADLLRVVPPANNTSKPTPTGKSRLLLPQ